MSPLWAKFRSARERSVEMYKVWEGLKMRTWYERWRYTHRAQNLKENAFGLGVLLLVFSPQIVVGVLLLLSILLTGGER